MDSLKKFLGLISPKSSGDIAMLSDHRDVEDPDGATLIDFGHGDQWTVRDAFEGTQIFGATGSGKTSGSGQAIAEAFLKAGFGGLVLTAKPNEIEEWRWFMKRAGRNPETDLIEFSPTNGRTFNFLEYERKNGSDGLGIVENIVSLFFTILEVEDKAEGSRGSDPFWKKTARQLIRNTIGLLIMAGKTLTMRNIQLVIASAPRTPDQFDDLDWRSRSFLFKCMEEALENTSEDSAFSEDFEMIGEYWGQTYPELAPETRSSVALTFSSTADTMMRSPLRELFGSASGESVTPEESHNGRVIIVNMPVQTFNETGTIAQVLFKYCWQRATLRRSSSMQKPVFLWADESQFFVNGYDAHFQTTARSARAATVFLTQNISNYYDRMPADKGKVATDSLLGNLQTKILHQNTDSTTNQWAAELIARDWMKKSNSGISRNDAWEGAKKQTSNSQFNLSTQQSIEFQVQPIKFTQLKKGGLSNNCEVEAFVFQGGRTWSHGKNFAKVTFKQKTRK